MTSRGKWERLPFSRLEQPISSYDKAVAVELWDNGRDTLEIANALKMPEFQIYNGLWRWRVGLSL